jgi:5-methylcytosine-specific restriction protein A
VPAGSRDWGGLVRFSNAVAFFITLEKGANRYAKEHRYNDRFDGDLLYWESRASHDKASSQVRILRDSDTAIIGFARVGEKVGNQTQAFSYLGVLRFVDWWGAKPVHFTWRLEAFPNGLDGSLQLKALAKWRPIQDESAKGTTEPRSERRRPNRSSGTTTARTEGATVRVVSNRYERDPRARQECLTFHGCVCFVCGFEFRAMYGDLGSGFTFVHHRIPIASRARMGEYELDPRRDLVPICGNCHAMVHRRQPADGPDGPPPQLPAEQSARLSELRRLALDDESTD